MRIIDATDLIVGRLATRVAKMALLNEEVAVVNSEKAIMTGKKDEIIAKYKRIYSMGVPKKGPFLHRAPEKLLRRIIRGMLPYKQPRGVEAFKRIKCYSGVPTALQGKETETFEEANIAKTSTMKSLDLGTLSKRLGAKL
jgi:large subunit ribosomal protein L13